MGTVEPRGHEGEATHDDEELRRWLQDEIAARLRTGTKIVALRRRPASEHSSHRCEVVTLQWDGGETTDVFLKDCASSSLLKDDLPACRERELRVYRDVLVDADLGTPRYHGSLWNESPPRFVLALEFVPGDRLHWCDQDSLVAAAAWLGRMQAYFLRHPMRSGPSPFLTRHDSEFFRSYAARATRAVSEVFPSLGGRLAEDVAGYDRFIAIMTRGPVTLVHGSFRKSHVLVGTVPDGIRVCPIDWEQAALGSPLYDLAFITDGCDPLLLKRMCGAYRDALAMHGAPPPDEEEMQRLLPCFHLHKILLALSRSKDWGYKEKNVHRLVESARNLVRTLADRTSGGRLA